MKASTRYVKIVEWSDEDQCYVGSCPGLFYGGCHGDNEQEVFSELCDIVEETIELYKQEGQPLPPPTVGKDYANKIEKISALMTEDYLMKRANTREEFDKLLEKVPDVEPEEYDKL